MDFLYYAEFPHATDFEMKSFKLFFWAIQYLGAVVKNHYQFIVSLHAVKFLALQIPVKNEFLKAFFTFLNLNGH